MIDEVSRSYQKMIAVWSSTFANRSFTQSMPTVTVFDLYFAAQIPSNPDPEHPIEYLLSFRATMEAASLDSDLVTTSTDGLSPQELDMIIRCTPHLLLHRSRQFRDLAAFNCSLVGPQASLYAFDTMCTHSEVDITCISCAVQEMGRYAEQLGRSLLDQIAFYEQYLHSAYRNRYPEQTDQQYRLQYERSVINHRVAMIEADIYREIFGALLQNGDWLQVIDRVMAFSKTGHLANLVYNAEIPSILFSKTARNLPGEALLGIQI